MGKLLKRTKKGMFYICEGLAYLSGATEIEDLIGITDERTIEESRLLRSGFDALHDDRKKLRNDCMNAVLRLQP